MRELIITKLMLLMLLAEMLCMEYKLSQCQEYLEPKKRLSIIPHRILLRLAVPIYTISIILDVFLWISACLLLTLLYSPWIHEVGRVI